MALPASFLKHYCSTFLFLAPTCRHPLPGSLRAGFDSLEGRYYDDPNTMPEPHANNPLHGITLEMMLIALEEHYGWAKLGEIIEIRCFNFDPSIKSSLKFLRKTPWARKKVEDLYLWMVSPIGK